MLSIITPVLNGEYFINNNILAIQKLNIPFEHILVDGGSTDNTLEIISKHTHVKLLHQTNQSGMYAAIHQGIKASKGKYISYINCDDLIVTEGFEKMYKTMEIGKLNLIYSDGYWHYSEIDKYIYKPGIIFGNYFLNNGIMPFIQPSSMWLRTSYFNCEGFDFERFKIIGDKDLFVRMSKTKLFKSKYINVVSSIFTKHGESLGDKNEQLYLKELKFCPRNKSVHITIL